MTVASFHASGCVCRVLLLALWLVAWLPGQSTVHAQDRPADRPVVGLALSGGNAKGFSHIGVLRVLEDAGVPIDVIAGTSMGAILGSLYAIGYDAAGLEAFVLTQQWDRLLSDTDRAPPPGVRDATRSSFPVRLPIREGRPRLPSSLAEGQLFFQWLARSTWPVLTHRDFRLLPIPFAAVATDLETGAAVRLDGGFLPDVLRATSAVPSVFAPVRLNGRLLADGALARNLPAEDARALGADVVICSDVSSPLDPADSLRSFVDVLNQAIAFRMHESNERQRLECDVLIEPDIRGIPSTAVERAAEWIVRGEAAALARLPELLPLARTAASPPPTRRVAAVDSVFLTSVVVEGVADRPRASVFGTLGLRAPAWVTSAELDRAIERVYRTGSFTAVRYRLDAAGPNDPSRVALVLDIDDRSRDELGLAYRYESRYKGSLLVGATVYNVAGYGSVGRLDVRIGEQARLAADFTRRWGPGHRFELGLAGAYTRAPFDVFVEGQRLGGTRVNVWDLSAAAGISMGSYAVAGVVLRGEHARGDASVLPRAGTRRSFYTVSAVFRVDTYDGRFFPSRGFSLSLKSEWADRAIGSNVTFGRQIARVRGHAPVTGRLAIFGGATIGVGSGDPPPHYRFYLGGSHPYQLYPDRQFPFLGLEPQAVSGKHVHLVVAGVQYEIVEDVFGQIQWNAGAALDEWRVDADDYFGGYGVTLGANTVVGPVRLTAAGRDFNRWPDLEIDVGYRF